MKTSFIKTITHTQPAVLLATGLAHASLELRWPATLVLFALLQVVVLLAVRRRRARQSHSLRFVARGMVVSVGPAPATPARRRAHLSLVP